MKKLAFVLLASGAMVLGACNGATNKRGGNGADSGATGSSGAADTSMAAGSGSPVGVTTSGTDTSKNGKTTDNPTVDSASSKKPKH